MASVIMVDDLGRRGIANHPIPDSPRHGPEKCEAVCR
jgi:hypothetical protein